MLGGVDALVRHVATLGNRADWIQLREKDLSGKQLETLLYRILEARPNGVKVLVNDRTDIALACGADGVHLRGKSISPSRIREIAPKGFLIGVSCHSIEDVVAAAGDGASFAVLAPIYESPGKARPIGIDALRAACQAVQIPVLALGGVNEERWPELRAAGAVGIAGIRTFQTPS